MNNPKRTESNKSRLRLKSFHRRNISIEVVQSDLDCNVKPLPINPGSGSGGNGEKSGAFTYTIETLKKVYRGRYLGWGKKRITEIFNKSQLIGKVILINGIRYRIISS